MDAQRIIDGFNRLWPDAIVTVDSHTAGEPTRLIVGGLAPVPGETMRAKREYFRQHFDAVRLRLTREPRGHRDMVAAAVTEPVSPDAAFGLLYMDARRYPFLCGHATIGAVTTLIETGGLPTAAAEQTLVVDTPSGPLAVRVSSRQGRVEAVAVRTVPAFVYATDQELEVAGWGRIVVDVVCIGGFLVLVDAAQLDIPLQGSEARRLADLGMALTEAANRQLAVAHPTRPEVTTVDGAEFYDAAQHGRGQGRNVVVYGEAHVDRSPCGTGTAAKMTLLHHGGRLAKDEPFINAGPLGTSFTARIVEETRVGRLPAVVVEISGSAHITGLHRFGLDSRDPFPGGFLL
jgi:proline racemase